MGQFKPMVKMTTTEPSVELKLKKGGAVEKMQMGGALAATPAAGPAMRGAPARGGMMPAASPGKPSMAARRRAMKAGPTGAAPAAPVGMAGRMMKDGGKATSLKAHADMPASKAHKGLKTGGVVKGQAGFATGGVAKGKGGYATGGVAKANGGGYKKGGEAKMAMGGMTIPNTSSTAPNTPSMPSRTASSPSARANPSRRYTSADALRYLRATGDKAGADQILNAAVGKQSNIPQKAFEMNLGREMAGQTKPSSSGIVSSSKEAIDKMPPMSFVPTIPGSGPRTSDADRQLFESMAKSKPYPGKPSIGTNTSPSSGPTGIGGNETPPPQTSGGMPNMKAPLPPTPPGGMKKGGAAKKAYATGGLVDSGRPVAMPQGAKKPSKPVSINRLSGTFKKGGAVMMNKGGDVPPKGVEDQIQTSRNERAYKAWEKGEAESAKKASEGMGSLLSAIPRKLKEVFSPSKAASAPGSVTKTEKSVTVTPKKRGGAVTC